MRRRLMAALGLAALIALSAVGLAVAAGGEKPTTVREGDLELTFNGGFTPTVLSPTEPTPIALNLSGTIGTVDGTHVPALREFVVETPKTGAFDVKGLPVCKAEQLQAQDTEGAEAICPAAMIGAGQTKVEIAFPEQTPIFATSKLLLFNGGERGGVTTLFVHAYITVPTPAAIVTTVKIRKTSQGETSVATIPKIAGGSGSVVSFSLTVGKKAGITLTCPSGKEIAHATAVFSDGTEVSADILRRCTPS